MLFLYDWASERRWRVGGGARGRKGRPERRGQDDEEECQERVTSGAACAWHACSRRADDGADACADAASRLRCIAARAGWHATQYAALKMARSAARGALGTKYEKRMRSDTFPLRKRSPAALAACCAARTMLESGVAVPAGALQARGLRADCAACLHHACPRLFCGVVVRAASLPPPPLFCRPDAREQPRGADGFDGNDGRAQVRQHQRLYRCRCAQRRRNCRRPHALHAAPQGAAFHPAAGRGRRRRRRGVPHWCELRARASSAAPALFEPALLAARRSAARRPPRHRPSPNPAARPACGRSCALPAWRRRQLSARARRCASARRPQRGASGLPPPVRSLGGAASCGSAGQAVHPGQERHHG